MDEKYIRLAGIAENSLVNGPGLRKVFFSQGCTHHCRNCFNPTTWSFEGGEVLNVDDLMKKVEFETFLDGVTFSGGDPFQQPKPFAYFAKLLKKKHINLWIYTGYTWEQLEKLQKINPDVKVMIENCDVIVDGPFVQDLADERIEFRGSSNQRIIDVPQTLAKKRIVLWKK